MHPPSLVRPDPPLADAVVVLEPMTQAHHAGLLSMVDDPDVRRFTRVPSDVDADFVTGWIDTYERGWADGTRAGFCIRGVADGAFLGFGSIVELDLAARQAELGYALPAAARGRGAATSAVSLLTRWGFESLGLLRLELYIDTGNPASERVAERCGYRLEGVLRSRHVKEELRADTGVWSRLSTD